MKEKWEVIKKDSFILLCIHAIVFLYLFYSFQRGCVYFGREMEFGTWVRYSIGDRYVLIMLDSISYILLCTRILSFFFSNSYALIREGSRSKLYVKILGNYIMIAFAYLIMESLLCLVIGVQGGMKLPVNSLFREKNILSLLVNLYLYLVTIGAVLLLLYVIIEKVLYVGILLICMVLPNLTISSSVNMQGKGISLSWIGNVMPTGTDEWSLHIGYWFGWIGVTIFLSCMYMRGTFRRLFDKLFLRCRGVYFFGMMTVAVFAIYSVAMCGISGATPLSEMRLSDYFVGFIAIDRCLIRYLFYTLPIMMYMYYYVIIRFSAFGLHVIIRGGGIWIFLQKIAVKCILFSLCYYLLGVCILSIVHYTYFRTFLMIELVDFLLPLINLWLENVILIFLSIAIWMWEIDSNYGFCGVLIIHLLLCVMRNRRFGKIAQYIPLTQGIYCLNEECQGMALIYQGSILISIVIFIYFTVKRKLDDIVTRKFKW